MTLTIRPACAADAAAMSVLLNRIIEIGGTTAHRRPFTPERMIAHYIAPPRGISCTAAVDGAGIVGFQALEWADPDWDGKDGLPPDWAVIASFVAEGQQGRGIGRGLFAATRTAAEAAGVRTIEATIRRENTGGLRFYASLGFVDYRANEMVLSKRFDLS